MKYYALVVGSVMLIIVLAILFIVNFVEQPCDPTVENIWGCGSELTWIPK